MIRLAVNPVAPDPVVLARAATIVRGGGVVAFPTDTLYGLAVDPFDAASVARVFDVKGRSPERGLPLVAADAAQIEDRLGPLPPLARSLARRFWPGPLTMLMAAPAELPVDVTAGTGRVGVRVPNHTVAQALCRACRTVLTATSANASGAPASNDPDVVAAALAARLDMLIDSGKTAGGAPSTIVDVTGDRPQLVREGAISFGVIRQWRA
jgi:L-threonylcarbamoyladenylate synthase